MQSFSSLNFCYFDANFSSETFNKNYSLSWNSDISSGNDARFKRSQNNTKIFRYFKLRIYSAPAIKKSIQRLKIHNGLFCVCKQNLFPIHAPFNSAERIDDEELDRWRIETHNGHLKTVRSSISWSIDFLLMILSIKIQKKIQRWFKWLVNYIFRVHSSVEKNKSPTYLATYG